jgi:hypothetical protein
LIFSHIFIRFWIRGAESNLWEHLRYATHVQDFLSRPHLINDKGPENEASHFLSIKRCCLEGLKVVIRHDPCSIIGLEYLDSLTQRWKAKEGAPGLCYFIGEAIIQIVANHSWFWNYILDLQDLQRAGKLCAAQLQKYCARQTLSLNSHDLLCSS